MYLNFLGKHHCHWNLSYGCTHTSYTVNWHRWWWKRAGFLKINQISQKKSSQRGKYITTFIVSPNWKRRRTKSNVKKGKGLSPRLVFLELVCNGDLLRWRNTAAWKQNFKQHYYNKWIWYLQVRLDKTTILGLEL